MIAHHCYKILELDPRQRKKSLSNPLVEQDEVARRLRFQVGAQVEAGGDVPDPHGMVPVDISPGPLGARQLQAPKRPRLGQHAAALVHQHAGRKTHLKVGSNALLRSMF